MAVLQIRRTGADEYGKYIRALFLGDPGAGKTLTASTWPNPLYASAEGGLMSVADRGMAFAEITASDQLLKLRNALNQPPDVRENLLGVPVDTLVVDTIDEIQRILIRERLETTKKETLTVQDFGWLGDQMRSIIRGLRTLPLHVVCTCHLKKGDDAGDSGKIMGPALQGQVGDEIAQYFDIVALLKGTVLTRVVGDSTKRVQVKLMQTYPDIQHPWIKDRSGKLAPEIELDFVSDYQQLFDAIYGANGSMVASADIRNVEDRHVAAQRQANIEKDLGASTADAKPTAGAAKKAAPAKATAPAKKAAQRAPEPAAEAPAAETAPPAAEAPQAAPEPAEEAPSQPDEQGALEVEQESSAESAPEPEPEKESPPESTPAPEESAPEPEPEPEPEAEKPAQEEAPAPEEAAGTGLVCEGCGGEVENDDQADLSRIRFRKVLCRTCFVAAKKSK
jgi:hypothetical protein